MLVSVIAQKKTLFQPKYDPALVAQAKVRRILEGRKSGRAHDHPLTLLYRRADRKTDKPGGGGQTGKRREHGLSRGLLIGTSGIRRPERCLVHCGEMIAIVAGDLRMLAGAGDDEVKGKSINSDGGISCGEDKSR
nr:hypothetical protein [Agrobacterium pusense]